MTAATLRRVGRGAAWSTLLVAGLLAADRLLVEPPPAGWTEADTLAEVPAEAGPLLVPSYLPRPLDWPPKRILWRPAPQPGWWLGLAAGEEGRPLLWLGAARGAAPEALAEVGGCLEEIPALACPPGWHHLSASLSDGRPLQVVGRMPPTELRRVLTGLEHARGDAAIIRP